MASCDHLEKLLFARKQCFRTLLIPDVIADGVPANDAAGLIAVRNATTLKPPIDAIVPSKARFEFVWLAGRGRAGKDVQSVGTIFRRGRCRPVHQCFSCSRDLAEIGRDRAVHELQFAGRRHEQDDAGDKVDDQA